MKFFEIDPRSIVVKGNVRSSEDPAALKSLSESILAKGMLVPVLVRKTKEGHELVAGHRRVKAAIMADVPSIPIVVDDIKDTDLFELQLIENVQREDLNPMDECAAYLKMLQNRKESDLIALTGKTKNYIHKIISLDGLAPEVAQLIAERKLSADHGAVIARIRSPKVQKTLAEQAQKHRMTPKELEHDLKVYSKELGAACFDKKDCVNCQHNSRKQKMLFSEDAFQDFEKCLNDECFNAKTAAHIETMVKAIEAKGHNVRVLKPTESIMDLKNVQLDSSENQPHFQAIAEECRKCSSFVVVITPNGIAHPMCADQPCFSRHVKAQLKAIREANRAKLDAEVRGRSGSEKISTEAQPELEEVANPVRKNMVKFFFAHITQSLGALFLKDQNFLNRLLLYRSFMVENPDASTITDILGIKSRKNSEFQTFSVVKKMQARDIKKRLPLMLAHQMVKFSNEEDIKHLAIEAKIGNMKFTPSAEFLECYTKDELLEMAKNARVKVLSQKREDIINALMGNKMFVTMFYPEELREFLKK